MVDPSIDWKVLEEDHAVWIYDSRHKNLALQYSRNFKRLFPYLQQMFTEVPDKTTFVISDYTDLPNGSATVFPYPLVTIYPVIPIPSSPIGESDDSFYEILVHEYTHILNMSPVHGLPNTLSWVFGSVVRPNAFLPRWYAEGLAVFTETYFTPTGGRLRSQNFEGLMRAFGRDKVWDHYEIDQLNDFQPDWFGGNRAYLLGGALMHDIATQHGLQSIGELNQRYSRRIPYFLSGAAHDQTGLDYEGLLSETYANLQKRVDDQLRTIQSVPVTKGTPLLQQGSNNYRPRFSPDGKYLAYIMKTDTLPAAVNLLTREANKPLASTQPKTIATGMSMEHLAWSADSKKLAYNDAEGVGLYNLRSDIYIYDVTKKKTDRLTHSARAGDLAFVNRDQDLVFVQNTPGSKQLAQVNLASRAVTTLYTPARLGSNLYGVIVEGQKVLFIEQYLEKKTLKSYDFATHQAKTLNDNIATSLLRKTPEGIMLTSSKSGVDNLYLVSELNDSTDLNKTKPLTNSETRVYDGDIDPIDKTLYYSEQEAGGVYIYAEPQAQWAQAKAAPPVTPLLTLATPQKIDAVVDDSPTGKEENFSSWPYMRPRYWMPDLALVDGGAVFQAATGASDPLGKNSYTLLGEWDTLTKKVGGGATYTNRSTPVEIDLDAGQFYSYFYSNDLTVKDTSVGIDGNVTLVSFWKNWNVGVGWRHSNTDLVTREYERSGPEAHLNYNTAVRRGYQISPESGIGFSLMNQDYIADLGNIGYNTTKLTYREFFPSLFQNHAIMLQINGTYSPELKNKSAIFYTSSLFGNYVTNQLVQPFLVRGYPSGNLIGYNMGTATLEYRFPIANIYRGKSTVPFFLRQIHGAVVGDLASLDGYRFDAYSATNFSRSRFGDKWFGGYGAEVKAETTVGYYLPVTFIVGVYRAADQATANHNGFSPFFFFDFQL